MSTRSVLPGSSPSPSDVIEIASDTGHKSGAVRPAMGVARLSVARTGVEANDVPRNPATTAAVSPKLDNRKRCMPLPGTSLDLGASFRRFERPSLRERDPEVLQSGDESNLRAVLAVVARQG